MSSPARAIDLEDALVRWRERDVQHALHPDDARAAGGADVLRALVLEHLAAGGSPRDLYSACARLGRLLAELGASPSLVASTIDGALEALGDVVHPDDPRVAPARASLAEGHAGAMSDAELARARRAWEYPACAVRVSDELVAIAAGFPGSADDAEVADWAARVALRVSKAGYARAVLGGDGAARAELEAALGLLGVSVGEPAAAAGGSAPWPARLAGLFKRS